LVTAYFRTAQINARSLQDDIGVGWRNASHQSYVW